MQQHPKIETRQISSWILKLSRDTPAWSLGQDHTYIKHGCPRFVNHPFHFLLLVETDMMLLEVDKDDKNYHYSLKEAYLSLVLQVQSMVKWDN